MHSTTFLFVFFLKGVVVAVEPTCTSTLLPPLKTGERGSSEPSIVVDKTFASDKIGRRVCEERIPTARDSFMVRRGEETSEANKLFGNRDYEIEMLVSSRSSVEFFFISDIFRSSPAANRYSES